MLAKCAGAAATVLLAVLVVVPVVSGVARGGADAPTPSDSPTSAARIREQAIQPSSLPVAERATPSPAAVTALPDGYAAPTLAAFVASDRVDRVVTAEVEGRGTRTPPRTAGGGGAGEQAVVVHLALDGTEVLADGANAGVRRKLEVRWVDGAPLPEIGDHVALVLGEDARRSPFVLAALTDDADANLYRWLGGPWNPAWGMGFTYVQVAALLP